MREFLKEHTIFTGEPTLHIKWAHYEIWWAPLETPQALPLTGLPVGGPGLAQRTVDSSPKVDDRGPVLYLANCSHRSVNFWVFLHIAPLHL